MTVRASRSRFNLQTLPAADYPRISLAQEQQQTIKLPQRDFRGLLKLAEFAMAQQDIRYYLNGMLLVVDKGSLQAVATDGHRLSYASLAVPGELHAAGSDPAAQDRARAGQASRGERRRADDRHPRQPGALPLRQHRAGEQGGRRQVSRLQPRHSRPAIRSRSISRGPSCCRRCSARRFSPTRNSAACGSSSAQISSRSSARTASRKKRRKSSRSPTRATRSTSDSTSPTCSTCCTISRTDQVLLAFGDANSSALITMPDRKRLQIRRDADAHLTSNERASQARGADSQVGVDALRP